MLGRSLPKKIEAKQRADLADAIAQFAFPTALHSAPSSASCRRRSSNHHPPAPPTPREYVVCLAATAPAPAPPALPAPVCLWLSRVARAAAARALQRKLVGLSFPSQVCPFETGKQLGKIKVSVFSPLMVNQALISTCCAWPPPPPRARPPPSLPRSRLPVAEPRRPHGPAARALAGGARQAQLPLEDLA